MKKILLSIILIQGLTMLLSAQDRIVEGSIVTTWGDSLSGVLKNKYYFSHIGKVKIVSNDLVYRYKKRDIRTLYLPYDTYISYGEFKKRFYKIEAEGNVDLYSRGYRYYFSQYPTDLNLGGIKSGIKLYCTDYPDYEVEKNRIYQRNVVEFVDNYNIWKAAHPESTSLFEREMHGKKNLLFKASFFYPGLGIEYGINDYLSVSVMLKNQLSLVNYFIYYIPYIDTEVRYYYDYNKRVALNKRTYKYTGEYVSLTHIFQVLDQRNLLGIEWGKQRVFGKSFYIDAALGGGYYLGSEDVILFLDLGLGYSL